MRSRIVIIGVVGGIASGKSIVTQCFQGLGAEVIEADRLGHEVLGEPEVRAALRARWGDAVFTVDGRVDRIAVAHIVFGPPPQGPAELAFLEEVTHPRIGCRMRQRLAELASRPELRAVVLDAPVLLEAGWDEYCNKIVFVEAPRSLRLQRARQRGWTEAEFTAREAVQKSLDEKRNCADWVIDNSQSPQEACRQVQQFWHSLG